MDMRPLNGIYFRELKQNIIKNCSLCALDIELIRVGKHQQFVHNVDGL